MSSVWIAERRDQSVEDEEDSQKPGHHFSLLLGPESSQTVTPDSTATDILGLQPGTSYHVAVSALRGREEGPPAVIVARTGQSLTQSLGS